MNDVDRKIKRSRRYGEVLRSSAILIDGSFVIKKAFWRLEKQMSRVGYDAME